MQIDQELILKAKEKLGEMNAEIISSTMQMENYNPAKLVGCCPNPKHFDNNPSCSYNPKSYSFHCFSCNANFDIIDAYMSTGCTFLEACERLFTLADMNVSFAEKGSKQRSYRYPDPQYANNKEKVYEYWKSRGISSDTIDYLEIEQDKNGNTLFQYYDSNDVLCGVRVRPSRSVAKGERKCWWLCDAAGKPYDTPNFLYNQNKINPNSPLVITSGEGDCASCIEAGMTNAVSICGGDGNLQWISEQWEFLNQFDSIVVVHDNDESGIKFAKEVSNRLGEWRVKIADIPLVCESEDGSKVKIKDMNELLCFKGIDAVREVILDAKDAEIPSIVDYTSVAKFDHTQLEGFTTGFKKFDAAIERFYVTTTTIITGIASSGKSSFLSSLICQSIEQDMPVMIYSGELSNESLKSWIDMCFAGQRGIREYANEDGSKYYKLSNDAYNRINNTYKGKCYFYKDSFSHNTENLLAAAESAVRKNGVKTIIFDNMSSVSLGGSDESKWTRQEEFVKQVVDFGKRWQVCCILVIHPKKMEAVRRMNLMDVGGVSATFNLAHRVLSLYRVQEADRKGKMGRNNQWIEKPLTCSVVVDVLKDRLGSANGAHIELYYDKPSRRFYDSASNLDRRYKWQDGIDYGDSILPYGCEMLDLEREVFG